MKFVFYSKQIIKCNALRGGMGAGLHATRSFMQLVPSVTDLKPEVPGSSPIKSQTGLEWVNQSLHLHPHPTSRRLNPLLLGQGQECDRYNGVPDAADNCPNAFWFWTINGYERITATSGKEDRGTRPGTFDLALMVIPLALHITKAVAVLGYL